MKKTMIAVGGACLLATATTPAWAQFGNVLGVIQGAAGEIERQQRAAEQQKQLEQQLKAQQEADKAAQAEQKRKIQEENARVQALEEESARQRKAAKEEQDRKYAEQEAKRKAEVVELQTLLSKAGYLKGSVDGVAGAGTRSAIQAFETDFQPLYKGVSVNGKLSNDEYALLEKYVASGLTDPRTFQAKDNGYESAEAMTAAVDREAAAKKAGFESVEDYEYALELGVDTPEGLEKFAVGLIVSQIEASKTFVTEHQSDVPVMDLLPDFAVLDDYLKDPKGNDRNPKVRTSWNKVVETLDKHPDYEPTMTAEADRYKANWLAGLDKVKDRFAENMALADAFIQKDLFSQASLELVRFREENGMNKPEPSLADVQRLNDLLEGYLIAKGIRAPEPGAAPPAPAVASSSSSVAEAVPAAPASASAQPVDQYGQRLVEVPKLGLVPESQAAFMAFVAEAQEGSDNAKNDMQRGGIKAQRDRSICGLLGNESVGAWIGWVDRVSANSEGMGVLSIELADGLTLMTMNNALSDIPYQTLIPPSSTLFEKASGLSRGDKVAFNGTFLDSLDQSECIAEMSLTLRGKLEDPEFAFRFSDIVPVGE